MRLQVLIIHGLLQGTFLIQLVLTQSAASSILKQVQVVEPTRLLQQMHVVRLDRLALDHAVYLRIIQADPLL